MAFYTNPGWSNLTPPPVSEQNLNDMSNALENAAYVEDGKLYDNNNNLVDIGNAKITLGSYVGNGSYTINIQIPKNQIFFIMLSANGDEEGLSTFPVFGGTSVSYENGFVDQLYMGQSVQIPVLYSGRNYHLERTTSAQDGNLTYTSMMSSGNRTVLFNNRYLTYHYATIGV